MKLLHECMVDNCHIHGLGTTYPKHVFLDPYVQMIPNWSKNLHDTQMHDIWVDSWLGYYFWDKGTKDYVALDLDVLLWFNIIYLIKFKYISR